MRAVTRLPPLNVTIAVFIEAAEPLADAVGVELEQYRPQLLPEVVGVEPVLAAVGDAWFAPAPVLVLLLLPQAAMTTAMNSPSMIQSERLIITIADASSGRISETPVSVVVL